MRGGDIRDFMQPHYILLRVRACVRAYVGEAPGKCNCTVFLWSRIAFQRQSRERFAKVYKGLSVLFPRTIERTNRYIPFEILAFKSDDCVQGERSPSSRCEISRRLIRPRVLSKRREGTAASFVSRTAPSKVDEYLTPQVYNP